MDCYKNKKENWTLHGTSNIILYMNQLIRSHNIHNLKVNVAYKIALFGAELFDATLECANAGLDHRLKMKVVMF